jgi:2'-hydroxyisoflavone reductase
MKLLILGGTRFVGRHLVAAGLSRGHEITLFNRGHYQAVWPTGVENIVGDRKTDLAKLAGRSWNAVIDTCGYLPRDVKAAAEFLSQLTGQYVFISSQSVYADVSHAGIDETAPVKTLTNDELEEANQIDSSSQTSAVTYGSKYGGLKALCEQAAEAVMPHRVLNIRPGLIVGDHDYTDRFTYWPLRVACGGEVLAPGRPDRFVQFIDAQDLADWIVRLIEQGKPGTFNATGLPDKLTMSSLLQECKTVSNSDAVFTWVDDSFLVQEKVMGWSQMPLWLPDEASHLKGLMSINCDKAVAAGLRLRPLSDTIRNVLSWHNSNRGHRDLQAGLGPGQERGLLSKWHELNVVSHQSNKVVD